MRQNHIGTVEARVPEIPLTRERVLERLLASEPEIRALMCSVSPCSAPLCAAKPALIAMSISWSSSSRAKTYSRFLALADLLEEHLGRKVEIVTVETLSPFFAPQILSEAEDVLRAA